MATAVPGATPMAKRTTTSYLILGLLCSRDWSAYELAEQLGRGVTELWPRAGRQLYNAPKRLVEEGLAAARTESSGGRNRTVYSITPAGVDALREWLADGDVAPSALEFEGMVRVLLADQGTVEDLDANLATMAEQAKATRDLFIDHARFMLATKGGTHPDRLHLFAMVNRFTVEHFDHIVRWATWAREEIADWPDAATPAQAQADRAYATLERSLTFADPAPEPPTSPDR
ncbi:MAG: PadR family transcriptional regulator [Acidimicrobiales bacterium]